MNRWILLRQTAPLVLACAAALAPWASPAEALSGGWSEAERSTLAAMQLARLPGPPADPSNAAEARPEAIDLGRRLFSDTRLSGNGQVSCASCHDPARDFQDGRPLGRGRATGARRTMPLTAAAHGPWWFWDGRKDSLWSQALGPLEDAAEHGASRAQLALLIARHYRPAYESVFGALPSLRDVPAHAGPLGDAEARRAWSAMDAGQRDAVNRVFANLGKALAAYERTLHHDETRFDRYVAAVLSGDAAGQQALTPQEVRGLRLFVGQGQCATCHNGPLLSDRHFHNTGVPPRDAARPDRGRAAAVARVQADEFNCLGAYSDAPRQACQELAFIATDDPGMDGAFKTPGLRDVAGRAPYMHAGQLATLEEVVGHYARSPRAATGTSELRRLRRPIRLDEAQQRDLVAFLRALSTSRPQPDHGG